MRSRTTWTGSCSRPRGIDVEEGLLARLPELVEGEVEVIADATVLGLHRPPLEAPVHALRAGEEAKSLGAVERLWRELRLGRDGTIVAFGGGCTTDAAGFAAATYLRGVAWIAVPTTLVGQVDAAIGGKTAVNLPEGKNLVGAFHWPRANRDRPGSPRDAARERASRRNGRGREDGPARRRAALGAADGRASRALRRVQGGGLPARPVRARRAGGAQPRPHVRARARGGRRLPRPEPRRGGRARPAGGAAAVGSRHGRGRGGARAAAGARQPRRRLGRALARQEVGQRHAAARAARSTRQARDGRRAPGAARCEPPSTR